MLKTFCKSFNKRRDLVFWKIYFLSCHFHIVEHVLVALVWHAASAFRSVNILSSQICNLDICGFLYAFHMLPGNRPYAFQNLYKVSIAHPYVEIECWRKFSKRDLHWVGEWTWKNIWNLYNVRKRLEQFPLHFHFAPAVGIGIILVTFRTKWNFDEKCYQS